MIRLYKGNHGTHQTIKDENIRKAATSFRGEIWHVPPMFSTIKVHYSRVKLKANVNLSMDTPQQFQLPLNFEGNNWQRNL
jgi:tRNA U55 pseudouridine synthase TruB